MVFVEKGLVFLLYIKEKIIIYNIVGRWLLGDFRKLLSYIGFVFFFKFMNLWD